ncbi:MAG TPA: AAA family ATPase [Euzebyales bacterium]|nr:AAA family ATPase [Euzebyales bacterium]
MGPDDEVVARVFEPADLLDVGRFQGLEPYERIAENLIDLAWDERDGHNRQPGPPLSILLHGPSRVAMAVLAHTVAWGLDADLVQVFAAAVLPSSNGGSQPIVAPAVNKARGRRRSVLFIDQLDMLSTADGHDVRRQRAMNDLVAEVLRPAYGRAPIVIAAYVGDDAPDRRLTDRFEHIVFIDVPESDDAEVAPVRHRSASASVRTAPTHAHVQHGGQRCGPTMESAA